MHNNNYTDVTTEQDTIRQNCTSNQNLACFVRYLQIINTVLKNNISILKQIISET